MSIRPIQVEVALYLGQNRCRMPRCRIGSLDYKPLETINTYHLTNWYSLRWFRLLTIISCIDVVHVTGGRLWLWPDPQKRWIKEDAGDHWEHHGDHCWLSLKQQCLVIHYKIAITSWATVYWVSQLVYGHFVYDTSSTDISSTDISSTDTSSTDIPSTMTLLAEIEAGVMKRILYQYVVFVWWEACAYIGRYTDAFYRKQRLDRVLDSLHFRSYRVGF